jgi:hypothetical protein
MVIKTRRLPKMTTESVDYDIQEDEIDNILDLDDDCDLRKNTNDYSVTRNIYRTFIEMFYKTTSVIVKVSGAYLLWILLHYAASHLYVKLCVSNTALGFLLSPFMTVTPHCQGLRWAIYTAANVITNMWIVIGTWFASTVFSLPN